MRIPFLQKRVLVAKLRHMISDKLPIVPFEGFYIAPAGSTEIERRRTVISFSTKRYGELVVLGNNVTETEPVCMVSA